MNLQELVISNPFIEFALILFLGALLGAVGQLLRQPLIVMFILLGIIVGPSLLDVVKSKDNIHLLADIGISVLLFIVGLKLDLRIIQSVGKIALLTGLGQVVFTSLVGYFIGIALGFSSLHSFYIAVALTFSSTIIIVKLLSDKKEIDSLHGQIAIGFLIVQDIVVILFMIVLSALRQDGEQNMMKGIGTTLLSGGALIVFTYLMMKFVIPRLSMFLAKSQELLTLFAIGWAVTLAGAGDLMGFSREVGAFLAGVSLASSQFREMISSRLVSLRDFLLLFFFVHLGSNLDLTLIGGQVTPAIIFSVFVLVGNPIIVLIIMGTMGYRKRTSFLAGLTVAQISEFSLIFAGLGLSVGHINNDVVGLITLVGLITIGLSTYLILYSHQIYQLISPALNIFQRSNPYRETFSDEVIQEKYDLVIFGMGRFGKRIAEMLDQHPNIRYFAIDFDPLVVEEWKQKGKSIIYGDIEDPELLDHVPLQFSTCVLSTISASDPSIQLVKALRERNYTGKIFLTAMNERDMKALSNIDVDDILLPHSMAATNFYDSILTGVFDNKKS